MHLQTMHYQEGAHIEMVSIRDYIKSLEIKSGDSLTLNCPVCGGYKKFSVSNLDGMVVYNCYRASCGTKGAVKVNMAASDIKNKLNGKSNQEYLNKNAYFELPEYVTVDITNSYMRRFIDRWSLHHVFLLYDVKDKRAVFPILYRGRIIDAVGRSLIDKHPKWLRYSGSATHYSFCIGEDNGIAVVVEDVISATAIGLTFPQVTGVAILGTSFTTEHKKFLEYFNKIVIALDPDAADKTLSYTMELKSFCEDSEVLAYKLKDDVKYRKKEDINGLRRITNVG